MYGKEYLDWKEAQRILEEIKEGGESVERYIRKHYESSHPQLPPPIGLQDALIRQQQEPYKNTYLQPTWPPGLGGIWG